MKGGVCLGGTFNRIHSGHISMLKLAFSIGPRVYIGLTSDAMASKSRKNVAPYEVRKKKLESKCHSFGTLFEIMELNDAYGYSTRLRELKGIVVSEATNFRVAEINRIRESKGFKPLASYVVPIIRSFNGLPLSSTRVISGDCDRNGKLLHPMRVGIGSRNASKISAVKKAFALYGKEIGQATFRTYEPLSNVPEQPFGTETIDGALSRARDSLRTNDLGIGIEAGLFSIEQLKAVFDVQYCVIIDRAGRITSGHGMGFSYPSSVLDEVAKGRTIGDIMSSVSGIKDIGSKKGAIGYLSLGRIGRRDLTVQAVLSALIPRLNPQLYS